MITAGALGGLGGVRHGFLTRRGGVSEGIHASLNCGLGSRDDPEKVHENRRRAVERLGLGGAPLITVHQIHSAEAVTAAAPWTPDDAPEADAVVTDRPGVVLGVLTADCAPVLLADPHAGVIGAAHAGWKGALGGILDSAVGAMEALGAEASRITAAVGPCIQQASYEVGAEFPAPFLEDDPANERWFTPGAREGHHQFDLPGYVVARLEALGVKTAESLGADTRDDEERFFSYRRACLRGEGDYGRGLSAIALEG